MGPAQQPASKQRKQSSSQAVKQASKQAGMQASRHNGQARIRVPSSARCVTTGHAAVFKSSLAHDTSQRVPQHASVSNFIVKPYQNKPTTSPRGAPNTTMPGALGAKRATHGQESSSTSPQGSSIGLGSFWTSRCFARTIKVPSSAHRIHCKESCLLRIAVAQCYPVPAPPPPPPPPFQLPSSNTGKEK